MAEPKSDQLLEEVIWYQSLDLQVWWATLQNLDPQLTAKVGQVPVFDDEEYRRRGRDPLRPTYDLCDVQDFRDRDPGVWMREARRRDRLAEFVVSHYFGIHQPMQPGLALLLTRAVDTGDRRLARFVRAVAAASQDLRLAEQLVGMDLGTAYAVAGRRPCWAAPLDEGARAFAVSDAERFERQEPYLFLLRLVDGLVKRRAGWQLVADITLQRKAA